MPTHTRRFRQQFASPLGQGLGTLANALFGNIGNRQMLQLQAERIGNQNLANQLLVEDRTYDLQQKKLQDQAIQNQIEEWSNDPEYADFIKAYTLDKKHPTEYFSALDKSNVIGDRDEAIDMLRNRIKNDPDHVGQHTNALIGALYGKPSAMSSAFTNYAQEADRVAGIDAFKGQNVDLGYIDSKTGKPVNTPVSDMLKVNPNWSQIGSGSVAPSAKQANIAQKKKYESSGLLDNLKTKSIEQVQKSLKDVTYPLKDETGKVIAQIPIADIYTGDPKAFADILSTTPKLAKAVNEALKVKWDVKTSKYKAMWEKSTYSDRVDKAFWDNQNAESVALLRDLELDLRQQTFNAEKNQEIFDAYEKRAKAVIKMVEATKGKVMSFERRENGDLVARGQDASGNPFQKTVDLGDVLRIPKGKVVLSGKDNGTISYQSYTPEGKPTLEDIGDRGGISRRKKIQQAKGQLIKMIDIAMKHPNEISGGLGLVEELKLGVMAFFNQPAVNAKGEPVDYRKQFTGMGNRILLSIAPFILSSTGSKISDKDMERIDKAYNFAQGGGVVTNITEVFETLQAMGRALKAVDEGNPDAPKKEQLSGDNDIQFAGRLNVEQIKAMLKHDDENPDFLSDKQRNILETTLGELGN